MNNFHLGQDWLLPQFKDHSKPFVPGTKGIHVEVERNLYFNS